MKAKQAKQQMVILAGLYVVSHDFSDEFPCSGIHVIHKISAVAHTLFAVIVTTTVFVSFYQITVRVNGSERYIFY